MKIELIKEMKDEYYKQIDKEFDIYARENGLVCDYKQYAFYAKEDDEIIGFITGHCYYDEGCIDDLIILKEHRHKHIGSQLVKSAEEHCKSLGYNKINLSTYAFQAPNFYQKLGYKVAYIRENKENSKLTKYYLSKEI